MKRFVVFLVFFLSSFITASDNKYEGVISTNTVGFLQGGGGLIGVDHERMLSDHWGASAGIGIFSFGFAIHYHIEPSLVSNSIALVYWNQGLEETMSARYLGLTYVFRSKTSGWSGQLGLGSVLYRSKKLQEELERTLGSDLPSVVALYSIGYMF